MEWLQPLALITEWFIIKTKTELQTETFLETKKNKNPPKENR